MSAYFIIFIFLLIIAGVSFILKKDSFSVYITSILILTAFLAFRYGQGSDYPSYNYIYMNAPSYWSWKFDQPYYIIFHSEIGWKILNNIFRIFNIQFEVFIAIISIIEMICITKFINEFCDKRKHIALLMIYPTLYLTYMFSALRQGLVITIFLGVLLKWLIEKQTIKYFLFVGLLCTIHSSAFLFFLLPILCKVSQKGILRLILITIIGGVVLNYTVIQNIYINILNKFFPIDGTLASIKVLFFVQVIINSALILIMKNYLNKEDKPKYLDIFFNLYLGGICIYFLTYNSRLVAALLFLDIPIYICMIEKIKKSSAVIFVYILLLCSVLYIKNINSYIEQGNYYPRINTINYPYVSIFDRKEILEYRQSNINYLRD